MSNQPSICKELITEGWRFKWNAEKRRVDAVSHAEGYQFHFVEILPVVDPVDVNEIGEAITKLMQGETQASNKPIQSNGDN